LRGLAATSSEGSQEEPAAILTKSISREVVFTFMNKYSVPGMSVAVAKNGELLYAEGFGYSNRDTRERTTTHHLFRIGSISKPFTAVAIMRLVEERKMRLSDRVFGPAVLLGSDYGNPPFKRYVDEITVEQLMTHTAGGWANDGSDPMFRHQEFDHRALIAWAIRGVDLKYRPGTHFAYSNFGYCILGRVIEKVTGLSYESAVQKYVLDACGIHTMKIGGSTFGERVADEVAYYGHRENPYGWNLRRMDSHGGWIASATDLVNFLLRVDGFDSAIHSL
jgi:CubicO group peptidase (beta-lactamase class C family)